MNMISIEEMVENLKITTDKYIKLLVEHEKLQKECLILFQENKKLHESLLNKIREEK